MQTRTRLTSADHGRPISWDEFEHADSQDGHRYELIEGRVFVSPIPGLPHDDLVDWLKGLLIAYSQQHPEIIGRVKGPARVFLPERSEGVTAPEPDVVCYAEYPSGLPRKERNWRNVFPILVVEILSEDDRDEDLERNRRLYLEVESIREYWIIDSLEDADRPSLIVYARRGRRWAPRRLVPAGGTYTTPLLPEFSLVLDSTGI